MDSTRIAVMAAMETGNIDRARSLVTELEDIDAAHAASIAEDVYLTYGEELLN